VPAIPETPPAARLPASVRPTHYSLHLDIDPRLERFTGTTQIDVELASETPFLWIHGVDLEMTSATAILDDGETIELSWEQVFFALPLGIVCTKRRVSGKSISICLVYL